MNRVRTQCCIVGGGPAGVMAGFLLARAGVKVEVLEKHGDFFRDFRGDTVHPSSLEVLGELGILDEFLQRPHQELSRIRAHIGDAEVNIADFTHLPTRRKFIAFMPQWDFLDFLVEKARAYPGFSIRMETEANDLIEEVGRVVGVRARNAAGYLEVRAPLVIAADGRTSVLRARSGLPVIDVGAPIDVLWMRLPHRPGDPTQSLGWAVRGRFMALIDRSEYWQIAFVIRKGGYDILRQDGIEAFRRDLAETAPFLADRVDQLRSFDDVKLLVVKIDRLEKWWKPGFLCIGDSAHAMSPVGGVGINLAVQDAVAAANLLAAPLLRGEVSDRDLERVQRRRSFPVKATQRLQSAIQDGVIGPVLAEGEPLHPNRALRVLDRAPLLQRLTARLVGIGFRPEHVTAFQR
jgi:2-polyprenyl-6-methoxyphenol hydroxylase-like FAD-dependent oxidoreductase